MSVTELTSALSPGQTADVSTSLPTRDDLRFGEVDLEEPPFVTSLAPSAHPGTVANPSRHTTSQISPTVSGRCAVPASVSRGLVAPPGQSPVVLMDTSPAASVNWFEVHCKMWTQ